jgi:hypothetical protein
MGKVALPIAGGDTTRPHRAVRAILPN